MKLNKIENQNNAQNPSLNGHQTTALAILPLKPHILNLLEAETSCKKRRKPLLDSPNSNKNLNLTVKQVKTQIKICHERVIT